MKTKLKKLLKKTISEVLAIKPEVPTFAAVTASKKEKINKQRKNEVLIIKTENSDNFIASAKQKINPIKINVRVSAFKRINSESKIFKYIPFHQEVLIGGKLKKNAVCIYVAVEGSR